MQNKIICLIIIIFLNACGYTPLYQNNSNLNFSIEITEIEGDRKVNEAIKSNLQRFSKKSNEKINYEIKIKTNLTKKTISKNKTGAISQIKLITKVTFVIKSNELERTFLLSEEFNIKKNNETIDEKEYEDNIKENMGTSISEKLIFNLSSLK